MKISLIVPVFNEEQTLGLFYKSVRQHPALAGYSVEIIFINDGSTDQTDALVRDIALVDNLVVLINFSRNFGKEPALFAGIEHASGDVVIPMETPSRLFPSLLPNGKRAPKWCWPSVVIARPNEHLP